MDTETLAVNNQENSNYIRELFGSILPGRIFLRDKDLIQDWLFTLRNLFRNPKKELYGYRKQYKSLAKYWLQYGEHCHDCSDPTIIRGQKMWDEYLQAFRKIDENGVRFWL